MLKTSFLLITCLFLPCYFIFSQQLVLKNKVLSWDSLPQSLKQGDVQKSYIGFSGALYQEKDSSWLPLFYQTLPFLSSKKIRNLEFKNAIFEEFTQEQSEVFKPYVNRLTDQVEVFFQEGLIAKKRALTVQFCPVVMRQGKFFKLKSFDLVAHEESANQNIQTKGLRSYKSESALASGTFYKLAVAQTGIYKIDYQALSNMGVDVDNINPSQIRLYGNGGGQLSYQNNATRTDDLKENSIYVHGQDDSVFNQDDYILFYATEASGVYYNQSTKSYYHVKNTYSDSAYYFLCTDKGPGLRVQPYINGASADTVVNSFLHFSYHHRDQYNFLKSGREWYGEEFGINTTQDFNFYIPNRRTDLPTKIKLSMLSRSVGQTSSFTVSNQGNTLGTHTISSVAGGVDQLYAQSKEVNADTYVGDALLSLTLTYNKANEAATGWLNYIEVNAPRELMYTGPQMPFSNTLLNNQQALMQFSNTSSLFMLWDVTKIDQVKQIQGFNPGDPSLSFVSLSDTVRMYMAFSNQSYLIPRFVKIVENQNLHALTDIDYLVITHPDFISQANEFADFHTSQDNLSTAVATTEQIYNEFSSGSPDITALKDYIKMFYDKAGADVTKLPQYVLLLGDGSFDARGLVSKVGNFIPTYQSLNSLEPAGGTYVSDDYLALLDDTESDLVTEKVDISIGRLPVRTSTEAQRMIDKVKYYYNPETQRSWRNFVTFVADDEDNNLHMSQADNLTKLLENNTKNANIEKIFLDAYDQISSSGGSRYPAAKEAVEKRMEKGSLILSYTGHGNELSLSAERIIGISDINSWTNKNNLTAMVTATCEFSRFDDPLRTSAGELVILNPDGGAIGLLTTTRLVYASPNFQISQAFFEHAFDRDAQGNFPRLGDLAKLTKIYGPAVSNTRNFTLLGDPAVRLAYPFHGVKTTIATDTMRALAKVNVKGYVTDFEGNKLNAYQGVLYPTVFDKKVQVNTLNNDGDGVFTFENQKNVLFNGKVSVKNGDFEFSFVIPKDIIGGIDTGKISYYFTDQTMDGNGFYDQFVVGGIDSTAAKDDQGPQIGLYLNDETFVSGGITNEMPEIYAVLEDENGINTTGSGIGHDITAVLDENTSNRLVLNDFYEADLDSYQKGRVQYPLSDLSPGKHTLRFKAWDVHNNSSEAYLEFTVAQNAELSIDHVLNYPNPFTTQTGFYFEHNIPGSNLDVIIQIMTVSGKLIKTINTRVSTDGFRVGPIEWDGRDEFGDLIGKGVYIYRLKVIGPTGKAVEKIEKLVLLK